jgi:hypothetical protein
VVNSLSAWAWLDSLDFAIADRLLRHGDWLFHQHLELVIISGLLLNLRAPLHSDDPDLFIAFIKENRFLGQTRLAALSARCFTGANSGCGQVIDDEVVSEVGLLTIAERNGPIERSQLGLRFGRCWRLLDPETPAPS